MFALFLETFAGESICLLVGRWEFLAIQCAVDTGSTKARDQGLVALSLTGHVLALLASSSLAFGKDFSVLGRLLQFEPSGWARMATSTLNRMGAACPQYHRGEWGRHQSRTLSTPRGCSGHRLLWSSWTRELEDRQRKSLTEAVTDFWKGNSVAVIRVYATDFFTRVGSLGKQRRAVSQRCLSWTAKLSLTEVFPYLGVGRPRGDTRLTDS